MVEVHHLDENMARFAFTLSFLLLHAPFARYRWEA